MKRIALSRQSLALLQYLAAPRHVQRAWLSDGAAVYGYEGRESYGEARNGLPLLFLVGEDFLAGDCSALAGQFSHDGSRIDAMRYVCSLVRFALESGSAIVEVMASDDEDFIETYASGMWQVLRLFSKLSTA